MLSLYHFLFLISSLQIITHEDVCVSRDLGRNLMFSVENPNEPLAFVIEQ